MIVEIVSSQCIFSFVNDLGIYATILELSMLCLEPAFSFPCVDFRSYPFPLTNFERRFDS
jgi:hypothetical protein